MNPYAVRVLNDGIQYLVRLVFQLLISKVICIKTNTKKFVKLIDLSGFSVTMEDVQKLLDAKFTRSERTTIMFDLEVLSINNTSKWIEILRGNDHINFKIEHFSCDNIREPFRKKILDTLENSRHLCGVTFTDLAFESWPEVYRCLTPIEACQNLTKLSLPSNNLFDDSANDVIGRAWINRFLRKFKHLKRLDLSRNQLQNRMSDIMDGIDIEFLAVSNCQLTSVDLENILKMKSLAHLEVMWNVFELNPRNYESNRTLQILEIDGRSLNLNCFLKKLHNLEVLSVSSGENLTEDQIVEIIESQYRMLNIMQSRNEFLTSDISEAVIREKLLENFYDFHIHEDRGECLISAFTP